MAAFGALLAALVVLAPPAAAQELQEPRARQGYYVALGAHGALQHFREEGDGLGVWTGFNSTLRLGQLITERLGIGFQLDVGGGSRDQASSNMMGAGIAGQFEVAPNLALHAVTGFGVVNIEDPDEEEPTGTYGAAFALGITYDWFPAHDRRTGGWAITPSAQVRALPGDPIAAVALFAGVEVSYWSGLPKNQLELDPDAAFE